LKFEESNKHCFRVQNIRIIEELKFKVSKSLGCKNTRIWNKGLVWEIISKPNKSPGILPKFGVDIVPNNNKISKTKLIKKPVYSRYWYHV